MMRADSFLYTLFIWLKTIGLLAVAVFMYLMWESLGFTKHVTPLEWPDWFVLAAICGTHVYVSMVDRLREINERLIQTYADVEDDGGR
jgi:hypothetical protein